MKLTRRQLAQLSLMGLAGYAAMPFASSETQKNDDGLNILVLGGTGFLGPHIVQRALAMGHTLTLFNRGQTSSHVPPGVEILVGDRDGDLKQLANRKWDVVIDTSSFLPKQVAKSASLLADNTNHYIYLSSTAVYKDWTIPNMDESAPLYSRKDSDWASYNSFQRYGALKADSELEVRKVFANRSTIIRPNTIVGPGDHKHFRYPYWTRRAAEGGEILGPGSKNDPIQFIDVRDLGDWIVLCAENAVSGTFNASSPAGAYTIEQLIDDNRSAAGVNSSVVWIDSDFLVSQMVFDIPFWTRDRSDTPGKGYLNTSKARQNGLKQRLPAQTAVDVYEWYRELPKEKQGFKVGLTLDQEKQIIENWKRR